MPPRFAICMALAAAARRERPSPGVLKGKRARVWRVHPAALTANPKPMLYYTIVFFIVAIIAAILGFGVIAGTAAWIAKICFFVFIVLAVVSLLFGKKPTV
jgi:uncharacterized membrane protein YtjA (UPF0391 family)